MEVFSIAVSIVTLTAVCAFLTEMEELVSCLGDLSIQETPIEHLIILIIEE